VRLIDLPDTIDLAFDKTVFPDDGRCEPSGVVVSPRLDVAELPRLDPTRIELGPDPALPKRSTWRGPIGSLLFHFLPLLALVTWLRPPLEIPPPIPVKLVIEQPPPPPSAPGPTAPKPEPKPPPGRRASDDMGQLEPDKTEKGNDTAPPTSGEPQPPAAAAQPAEVAPEPPPKDQAAAELPPTAAATQVAAVAPPPLPKPAPPKPQTTAPPPKPDGWILPLSPTAKPPHEARHFAAVIGPNATRDEYCAYALRLTISHIDLLPLSLVGARRGDTIVGIRVLEDGTITRVRVVQGSGYTDIDERVAQMAIAVGHLPPLPQWMPGPYQDFTFHLHFPNPEQR
jgi:TonB family protein